MYFCTFDFRTCLFWYNKYIKLVDIEILGLHCTFSEFYGYFKFSAVLTVICKGIDITPVIFWIAYEAVRIIANDDYRIALIGFKTQWSGIACDTFYDTFQLYDIGSCKSQELNA